MNFSYGRATISVIFEYGGDRRALSFELNGPMREVFKPMDQCTDAFTQAIFSPTPPRELMITMERRPDYAGILAKELAEKLVLLMGEKDTENGYKKGK